MASCDLRAAELQAGKRLPLEVLPALPAGTSPSAADHERLSLTPSVLSLPSGSFLIAKITAMR